MIRFLRSLWSAFVHDGHTQMLVDCYLSSVEDVEW